MSYSVPLEEFLDLCFFGKEALLLLPETVAFVLEDFPSRLQILDLVLAVLSALGCCYTIPLPSLLPSGHFVISH